MTHLKALSHMLRVLTTLGAITLMVLIVVIAHFQVPAWCDASTIEVATRCQTRSP